MNFIFLKILSILKKYTVPYFIIYLISIILVIIVQGDNDIEVLNTVYTGILGYCKFEGFNFLLIIMKFFNIGLLLYCSFIISYKFIVESIEFIFLRIKKSDIFLLNIVFSVIILILLRVITYLFLSLILYLFYGLFIFNYIYIIYDMLIITIIYISTFFFVKINKYI